MSLGWHVKKLLTPVAGPTETPTDAQAATENAGQVCLVCLAVFHFQLDGAKIEHSPWEGRKEAALQC